jgi:hypothetical protein
MITFLGTCTNSYCRANNQSRIICQWGYKNFDFFDDEHKCKCPLCDKYVQPITCGFYDTKWKITGYKKVAGSSPEAVNGSWNTAPSDGYTTFDLDLTNIVQWKELKIEIKRP